MHYLALIVFLPNRKTAEWPGYLFSRPSAAEIFVLGSCAICMAALWPGPEPSLKGVAIRGT